MTSRKDSPTSGKAVDELLQASKRKAPASSMMQAQLGRRALVRGAGAAALLGAGGVTLGCAAISGARPFLTLLGEKAAEGIGLTVGEDLGNEVTDLAGEALERLKEALGSSPDETLYGYAPTVEAPIPWSFLVAGLTPGEDDAPGEKNFDGAVDVDFVDYSMTIPAILALGFFYYTAQLFNEVPGQRQLSASRRRQTYEQLRRDHAIEVYEFSDGDLPVTKSCVIEAVTTRGRNLQIEWDPTTERTEQSRLIVREGLRLKDEDPQWDRIEKWGIPSHKLWEVD